MTRDQWLAIALMVAGTLGYLGAKGAEYMSTRPRNEIIYVEGKAQTHTVNPEGVDLDEFKFAAGFGAWVGLVWLLYLCGVFS